jgi:hypothetical protein
MKNLFAIAMILGFAVGCGGDDDKLARELSVDELKDKCEESNANAPDEPVTCEFMGMDIEIQPEDFQSDCDEITENDIPATCDVTVGQVDDCQAAIEDDRCATIEGDIPPACAPLFTEECQGDGEDARTFMQHLNAVRAHASRI